MKKLKNSRSNRLVKTTAIALFVATIMLLSSVSAVDMAIETSNNNVIYNDKDVTTPSNLEFRAKGDDNKLFADAESADNVEKPSSIGRAIFEEGFEGGVMPPTGWTLDELNLVKPWGLVDATTYPDWVHSGEYAAWINYDTPNPSDNWLITPDIDLTGYTDGVRFQFWIVTDTNWVAYATLEVYINNGTGNTLLWNLNEETWPDFIYYQKTFDLDAYVDQVVNISFRYVGQDGNSLGLDDIILYEPTADVGVVSIDSPVSGMATGGIPPEASFKNFGPSDLVDVPVQLQIGDLIPAPGGFFYDFEADNGGFTGTGIWQWGIPTWGPTSAYSGTKLWATNLGSNYIAGLVLLNTSPILVPDAAQLSFWHWYEIETSWDGGNVKISTDSGVTWNVITPEGGYPGTANSANPLYPEPIFTGTANQFWAQVIFDLSTYAGQTVQFRFDFGADTSVFYDGWYIDDVLIQGQQMVAEYDQTMLVDIDAGATVSVVFPDWIPDEWYTIENADIDYDIWALTNLLIDTNPANDFLDDVITLHFGYFHDIATTVLKPESGDAATLPVEVEITNLGQNPEAFFNVNAEIAKEFIPVSIFDEGFEGYTAQVDVFPPTGWSIEQTDPDQTWFKYLPTGSQRARCQESGSAGAQDEWLKTGTIDCSTLTSVGLKIYRYWYHSASGPDSYVEMLGSNDSGATWTNLIYNYTSLDANYGFTEEYDLTSWAAGESEVKIAWHFVSTLDTYKYDYFYFDDLLIGSSSTVTQTSVEEDFELTNGSYTASGSWAWGSPTTVGPTAAYSGSKLWGTDLTANYPASDNAMLETGPLTVAAGEDLVFYMWYDTEFSYDGMNVKISNDSGTSWTILGSYPDPYDDDAASSGNAGIPLEPCFSGHDQQVWTPYGFDLSAYEGQSVMFRFHFGSDSSVGYPGMYIDDVGWGTLVEATTVLSEAFDEIIPESGFPPAGWGMDDVINMESGADPNIWKGATADYSTTPTNVDPYSGDDMAIYDTGLLYPQGSEARLYTPAIPVYSPGAGIYRLEFMLHRNTYSSTAVSDLVVQYSGNGVTWYDMETISIYDSTNPGWVLYEIDITAFAGYYVYLGFLGVDGGYQDVMLDDISVKAYGVGSEYSESQLITDYIFPGETRTLTFPDWTPNDLAIGLSGTIPYTTTSSHDLADGNASNDVNLKSIELIYKHDVTVKEITEPSLGGERADFIGYDDGTTENAFRWTDMSDWQQAIQLTDTQLAAFRDYQITEVKFSCGSDLYGFYVADYEIWISDQLEDPTAPPVVYKTGTSSGTGWDIVTLDMPYDIPNTGDVYLGITFSNYLDYPAGVDTSTYSPEGVWLYSGGWVDGVSVVGLPSCVFGLDAGVTLGGGPGAADVFLKPGSQSFAAVMENLGTFPETGLTANAKLHAFNETGDPYIIYEENYTDFDLDVGEEETGTFGSYTFVDSAIYSLVIFLPLGNDVELANNLETISIGIDGTAPTSDDSLDPADPTGENGWYIGTVTVTLTADDGSEDWQSGVDNIFYKIDGGSTMTYSDPFDVSSNGEHTVTYWAEDNVGNKEADNTVDFDIDTAPPTIDLTWEAGSATNEVIFTATCTDTLSGMDKVEFYINDVLQETVTSAPYTWSIVHGAGTKYNVKAIAYDNAGNNDFDEIASSEGTPSAQSTTPLIK